MSKKDSPSINFDFSKYINSFLFNIRPKDIIPLSELNLIANNSREQIENMIEELKELLPK